MENFNKNLKNHFAGQGLTQSDVAISFINNMWLVVASVNREEL